uniref:PH domain-containing protein n=1 Tax=Macrostomum lignano TaxID=282301 RepID=A0A1I8IMC9_9PLAT
MPVPSSTVVIVSGPVRILINKKWKQRFCVIAKTPPYSASMKLFVYKEASDYKKSIDLVGQSPYDLVYGLDSEPAWKNERSSVRSILILTCHERLVLLGFSGPTELKPWHEKIAMTVQATGPKFSNVRAGWQSPADFPEGSEGRLDHVAGLPRICFYPEPAEACKQLAVWRLPSFISNDYMRQRS